MKKEPSETGRENKLFEEEKKSEKEEFSAKPTVVMTEIDSKIYEKMKSQPDSLDDVSVTYVDKESTGLHRMSLPPYFEKYSYDCTRGRTCEFHKREYSEKNGVRYEHVINHGKYVFRWLLKKERAIDYSTNVRGWYLVNRIYFSDAPRDLFSVSGGVELGDSILAFMPVEKAMEIRNAPSQKSQDLLNARMTPSKKKPNQVLMSGNPDDERIYMPDLGKESSESDSASESTPGSLQEGRDF